MHTEDVQSLTSFLSAPAAEHDNLQPDAPVDHLTYRWLRGKYARARQHFGTREIMAFRHTLYWHIGMSSSVGNVRDRHRPRCYALTKEWLFERESFHLEDCPDDDVWPCARRPPPNSSAAHMVQRVVKKHAASTTGALACGDWRLCWHRPSSVGSRMASVDARQLAAARCAARLRCDSRWGYEGVGEYASSLEPSRTATGRLAADDGTNSGPAQGVRRPRWCTHTPPEYKDF